MLDILRKYRSKFFVERKNIKNLECFYCAIRYNSNLLVSRNKE
jgi:hypothetical protein